MTEFEKMVSGEPYLASDKQLCEMRERSQKLCYKFNNLPPEKYEKRWAVMRELINTKGDFYIEQPFKCDYGVNISIGKHFYSNYNLCILDCGKVEIGDDVMIAPNVSIFTATHPLDAKQRCDVGVEYGVSIKIGNRAWIGGGAIILPGVTIGDEAVVGAGSVVTKDVPSKCVVAGNPARIVKEL